MLLLCLLFLMPLFRHTLLDAIRHDTLREFAADIYERCDLPCRYEFRCFTSFLSMLFSHYTALMDTLPFSLLLR